MCLYVCVYCVRVCVSVCVWGGGEGEEKAPCSHVESHVRSLSVTPVYNVSMCVLVRPCVCVCVCVCVCGISLQDVIHGQYADNPLICCSNSTQHNPAIKMNQ